jgi:16S rRNA (guanine(966)-N(2))-methyltransferase RsmD
MRVIAGSARRLLLKTIPGEDTRPTTDRIKETLFNMIQGYVPGSNFLDLFGGSGGIAIEALSRGAMHATIVEKNPKAVKVIEENLIHTHLRDLAEVISGDALAAVQRIASSRKKPFDIIFLDPPYDQGLEDRALSLLAGTPLADENTLAIVEMRRDADISHFEELGWQIVKSKEYKTNKHIFLRRGQQ